MQTLKDSLKTISISLITLSLVSITYAWTEPASNPPTDNVSTPMNTSKTGQIKDGGVWVGRDAAAITAGGGSGLIVENGNVGIGVTDPGIYRLNVAGDARIGSTLKIGSADAGNYRLRNDGGSWLTGSIFTDTIVTTGNVDVAGDIKIGNQATTCSSSNDGSIHYNKGSKLLELCDGTNWKAVYLTPAKPSINITINPNPIATGQSTTLSWSTTEAVGNCTASGSWSESKALLGSETISPSASATYTLTCTNVAGSTTTSATADVRQWQTVTGFGNFGESCNNFLTRTGQAGINNSTPRAVANGGASYMYNSCSYYNCTDGFVGPMDSGPEFGNEQWKPIGHYSGFADSNTICPNGATILGPWLDTQTRR